MAHDMTSQPMYQQLKNKNKVWWWWWWCNPHCSQSVWAPTKNLKSFRGEEANLGHLATPLQGVEISTLNSSHGNETYTNVENAQRAPAPPPNHSFSKQKAYRKMQ